jgi:hypothetical protein
MDWWDERRLREAYALGFFSVQEMKELQQQGHKTRSDYLAALKKEADALAIKAEDEARSLGFDNAEEMKNLRQSGFNTKAQYESFLAENERKKKEDDRRAAEQERAAQVKTPLDPNFLRQEIMSSRPKQQAIITSFTPDLYGKCLSVSMTMGALAVKYASADKALIENITNTLQLLNATLGHYRTHLISTGYPVAALNVAFRAYPIQGENIPEPWMNECLQVVSSVWVK